MPETKIDLNLVQHVDRNVGPGEYKQFGDKLLVFSVFHTLQGEGPFGGYPACFVRFAGCNIGSKAICSFCDTKFQFDQGKPESYEEIYERVKKEINGRPCNLVVITGGEPFLQKNIIPFIEFLNAKGFHVQVETNGTLFQPIPKTGTGLRDAEDNAAFEIMTNTIVCSPKMQPSGKYADLRPDLFDRADVLKFVVEKTGKFDYIPDYGFEFAKTGKKVYVSPINVYNRPVRDKEVPNLFNKDLYNYELCQQNYSYAAELCVKHGFILNIQKHLLVSLE